MSVCVCTVWKSKWTDEKKKKGILMKSRGEGEWIQKVYNEMCYVHMYKMCVEKEL